MELNDDEEIEERIESLTENEITLNEMQQLSGEFETTELI